LNSRCNYKLETEPQHKNIFSTNLQTEHHFTLNEIIKLFLKCTEQKGESPWLTIKHNKCLGICHNIISTQ